MHSRRSVLAALLTAPLAGPAPAHADCESLRDAPGASTRGGDTRINIVGNLVPALQHIARQMESCSRPGLRVSFKMTAAARTETELAFATTGASPVDLAVVSLALYANLQSNGQLQEMNDLVDKYRGHYNIEDGMLVRVNGRVMAIAFMRNTQNLYYRKDLFDQLGLKPPADYAEMVAAAQLLRLFLDRGRGWAGRGVDARALDDLYHSETDFDPDGPLAEAFERVLRHAEAVIDHQAP